MTDKPDNRPKPYSLRLDEDLMSWVSKNAKEGDRSINAEINRQLRRIKEADRQNTNAV